MEKYEVVSELGSGNFGVARLLRHKGTKELVAMKYIPRGHKVVLTPTHLGIVMEYAAGGELFDRICNSGRFSEDEARYFFQQLICGVSYCHFLVRMPQPNPFNFTLRFLTFRRFQQICHRDLKLENTLLDNSPAPRLKICDFGFSKSSVLHSRPKSTVGTPAYIAPEVLSSREYDGKTADVWSCGVTLFVMLVGAYPFEDPDDPNNFRKTIGRIVSAQYKIPSYVHLSQDCKQFISSIFVANPARRITISEIRNHPWFLKNLPRELAEAAQAQYYQRENAALAYSLQSAEEIMRIVEEARTSSTKAFVSSFAEYDESEGENDDVEDDDEYDKRVKEVRASGEYSFFD
ncbi:hypothetical protein ZIOFF_064040 [Zingiber officinale]|uniref:non-specific serine/threonine protein kinase n=1 Tax=Zingiber officinale TaxID=94328 RepID=A0A8J5C8G7_ZINOF|nr:hypothetical protein ZIOFF_064040 [Zingiber officinale]